MRGILHLLCTIMLLPYIALALWFLILGDAIAGGSLALFLDALLSQAAWMTPWAPIGIATGIVAVAALGLTDGLRWLGGLCFLVLATVCLVVFFVASKSAIGFGEMLFLLPYFAVLVFGGWLAVVEFDPVRQPSDAAQRRV